MTARLEPNPYSPFADADPRYRHIVPSPVVFPAIAPGVLAPTACDHLAVVPENLSKVKDEDGVIRAELRKGLCPFCVDVVENNGTPQRGPVIQCTVCGTDTRHERLCSLCRQSQHDEWWPTRDQACVKASEIELEGGDVMLQEMSVGDPIEIDKQTGPLHPGVWVITGFEDATRSAAYVRRLSRQEIEQARQADATARIYE